MDYFCYISRTKIDQLYEAAAPEAVDEWVERQTRQQNVDAKASAGLSLAGIADLFRGEVGYGRGRVDEREWKARVGSIEKLGVVLTAIAAERGEVPALDECLRAGGALPLYVHHVGAFRVTEPLDKAPQSQVVTLRSSIDGGSLLLDCSLRFFSQADESGKMIVHSGNHRFFNGGMPLTLETVFLFLHREGNEIFGSPLYLGLQASDDGPWTMDVLL